VQKFTAPHWGRVRPFDLSSGSELRNEVAGMLKRYPAKHYVDQHSEVLKISAELDDRKKTIAEYWADGPGYAGTEARLISANPAYLCGRSEGDRRGSNPRPSLEPQSLKGRCGVLPDVAETAYLSRLHCSGLSAVSECCTLGGVKVVSIPASRTGPANPIY
jgi:hypothetical protein